MARPNLLRSFAFALALAVPAPALAEPAKHAQAEEQFRQGREAQNKGDYRRALDLLRESQALEPGRGKLVNMAICEEQLNLLAAALRHLEEVLPQLEAGDERVPIVQKRLAQLRPRVPTLRIELAGGAPPAARVKLDEEAVAKLGAEIAVDPGKHTITVSVEGRAEARQEVDLKEQEHRTLRVDAGAPLAPAGPVAPPLADEPAPDNRRRIAGFAVGGAGVAGLLIGAGTGIASLLDHGSAASGCPTHVGCSQSVVDKAHQGRSLAIASTAAFVTGAALSGVGVYLVISSRPKAATGLVVLPGGARIEGRF